MMYTTRADGLDDPKPTKREPFLHLSEFLGVNLRLGFTLQFTSLLCLFITHACYGGTGLLSYDLSKLPEDSRADTFVRSLMTLFYCPYLLGALSLLGFQVLSADDTCWARGYRTASKLMRLATLMDVCASTFQMVFYLYLLKFYSLKSYGLYLSGGSEQLYYFMTRFTHGIALLLYAGATYLYEVYHDEGAGDVHAYINGTLFALAGVTTIIDVLGEGTAASSLFSFLALGAASAWSFFFEPEVNLVSPALHETELTNEVEEQVEQFAKISAAAPAQPSRSTYGGPGSALGR